MKRFEKKKKKEKKRAIGDLAGRRGWARERQGGKKKRGRLEGPSRVRRVRTKTLILQWSCSESMPRNACVSGHHWEDRAWHAPSTITFNSHRHKGPNLPQGFHMVLSLPTLSKYLDVFGIKCYRAIRKHFRNILTLRFMKRVIQSRSHPTPCHYVSFYFFIGFKYCNL